MRWPLLDSRTLTSASAHKRLVARFDFHARFPWAWICLFLLTLSLSGCSNLRDIFRPRPTATVQPSPTAVPMLTVEPDQGAPGTIIAVRGERWRAGDSVFIRLQNPLPDQGGIPEKAVAVATVQDDGRFLAGFIFPNEMPWAGLPSVLIVAQSQATGERVSIVWRVQGINITATPTVAPTRTGAPPLTTATPTPWVITATPTPWIITATPTPWIITATPTRAPATSTFTPAPTTTS